jgi:hypothetical protein
MAIPDWKLSLVTFPGRWDGNSGELHLRVLVVPRVSPLEALVARPLPAASEPPFVKASLSLSAMLIPSLNRLPDAGDVTAALPLNTATPPNLEKLYQELALLFPIAPAGSGPAPQPRRANVQIKKFLPLSYREAFAFDRPRTGLASVDDTYRCALKTPPNTAPPPAIREMSWGRVLAAVLQQPRLAERLGLVYAATVKLPSKTFFADGGWVFVALAAGSDYASVAPPSGTLVKSYAARLPALQKGVLRPLFAAVTFPVLTGPPPVSYEENVVEAENYDDGFAKVVHCAQPMNTDFMDPSTDSGGPIQDAGIQLGWDDEQLTIWMNRQIDPGFATQDAPMTVHGYRVDVRKPGTLAWNSLSRVKGPLRLGKIFHETFEGEHSLRVAPVQLHGLTTGDYWLPSYFASWTGSSLGCKDQFVGRLTSGDVSAPAGYQPVGLDRVPLRYGESYEFRVRLADIAGGGPESTDQPVNPAAAPVSKCSFRRFVSPKQVRIANPLGTPDPDHPQTSYQILRPVLGYPSLPLTGFPNATQALMADVPTAKAEGREVGLPDPDVATLEIGVDVRDPALGGIGVFRQIYATTRPFPKKPGDPVNLSLSFQDIPDIANLPATAPSGPLIVPTARDLRLRLTAMGKLDPRLEYFGSEAARTGPPSYIYARANSTDERVLLVPRTAGEQFRTILLQPDPAPGANLSVAGNQQEGPGGLAPRLAQQLHLDVNGLTFFGKPGRRTVFGASLGLRHYLAADHSAISLASKNELTGQWIAVLSLQLNRDWTWDALADVSFAVTREVKQLVSGTVEVSTPGTLEVRRTASATAMSHPDVTQTDLFFLDAIDPKPPVGEFPGELEVTYTVQASFKKAPLSADGPLTFTMRLPMAVPPTQTPVLVSAGLALSPYKRTGDYSSSEPRQRMLWLEFDQPLANPRDGYFGRVLAYAPDPMLTNDPPDPPSPTTDPPLDIDPEPIRVITPLESDDRSGIDAMQALIPSDSPRHFLVPLPAGLSADSADLLGFFVYELRVGHSVGWSTAQGRFGSPLIATGVQHPAPPLACQATRLRAGITASAPFARPVYPGRNVVPAVRATEIWMLLYAQVTQADGKGSRNILLGRKPGIVPRDAFAFPNTDLVGTVRWDQKEIAALLDALALRPDSSLSLLAVEVLPESNQFADPMGSDLGQTRILRTSPLTPVPSIC